jgi:ribosomal protein S27AE
MGWNDHVDFVQTECMDCGEIDVWEHWNEVALARYGGSLGIELGHDVRRNNRCPHCGSENGEPTDDD